MFVQDFGLAQYSLWRSSSPVSGWVKISTDPLSVGTAEGLYEMTGLINGNTIRYGCDAGSPESLSVVTSLDRGSTFGSIVKMKYPTWAVTPRNGKILPVPH